MTRVGPAGPNFVLGAGAVAFSGGERASTVSRPLPLAPAPSRIDSLCHFLSQWTVHPISGYAMADGGRQNAERRP
eukprot:364764-Chlamydomonas_euryale.AAC.7